MSSEALHLKYRPTTLKEVVGQKEAVKVIDGYQKNGGIPHAIMLVGPSGTGKTTLARIIGSLLQCGERDFYEVDCAGTEDAIATIRSIKTRMHLASASHKRVYYLDEAQSLSRSRFAQQAILKVLEEPPKHVYFIIATTEPGKLIRTVHTRCSVIHTKPLTAAVLTELVNSVATREEMEVSEEVVDRIVELSEGSARQALVLLEKVAGIVDDERLDALLSADTKQQAVALARALINPRSSWDQIRKVLASLKDEPEEGIRHMILGYASSVVMGGGKLADRAFLLLDIFREPFYDSHWAGLVWACRSVFSDAGEE